MPLPHPSPFDASVLTAVLTSVAKDNHMGQRLSWWLGQGFSCEHWMQFELAYRFNLQLQANYRVCCEKDWRDIVFHLPDTIEGRRPAASIELKWVGNWWLKDAPEQFKRDIQKVERYEEPSAALCLWLHVVPGAEPADPQYKWLLEQIDGGHGERSIDNMRKRICCRLDDDPQIDQRTTLKLTGFSEAHLGIFGHLNKLARSQPDR
ncbi:hypothetical protein YTPLAS18_40690 [Nitrospira sp.]|nr:hypothetical protein YTPLAS18_40690 [Nitrospira sp.]